MRTKGILRNSSNKKSVFAAKSALLTTVGASAIAIASVAYAQEAPSGPVESVTVSSSRIMSAGFNAPTPTTVLGKDFIENQAKDNIYSAVTELPSLMGSTGNSTGPHLHFEIRPPGRGAVNPLPFLPIRA